MDDSSFALGANGLLKDASEIEFYESESDVLPIGSKTAMETSTAGMLSINFWVCKLES